MKPLAIIDDRWHPGHVPREGLARVADFDWLDDGHDWSTGLLENRPVVVLSKSNHTTADDITPWADERVGEALLRYVESGGGLLVIHSGLSGYDKIPSMRAAITGRFLHHPPLCPVTVEPRGDHELCAGVGAFAEVDEHYFVEVDPAADVFLAAVSENGTQPAGWSCTRGTGRICVLTPGHMPAVWRHPSFQRLLCNCLAWCVGREGRWAI